MGVFRTRGTKMRGRRKYRVGARTVNFASIGLVASALVVVLEVTAPSSAPPAVFASGARTGGPGSSTLPLDTTAPEAVLEPSPQVLHGATTPTLPTSTVALAFSLDPGSTLPKLSHPAAATSSEFVTTAVPADVQRSHASAKAAQHSVAIPAAGSHGNGLGNRSGNSSANAKVGVAAAGTGPLPSPNVAVAGGNGNAGNGANGHANGPPPRSQAAGPPQPDPLVPSHPTGAPAPPGQGAGAGDPLVPSHPTGAPAPPGQGAGAGHGNH